MDKEEIKQLIRDSFEISLSAGWLRDEWSLLVTLRDKDSGVKEVLASIPTRTIKE